jgi:hypothetical protein
VCLWRNMAVLSACFPAPVAPSSIYMEFICENMLNHVIILVGTL